VSARATYVGLLSKKKKSKRPLTNLINGIGEGVRRAKINKEKPN
jgi:hypothetical protein